MNQLLVLKINNIVAIPDKAIPLFIVKVELYLIILTAYIYKIDVEIGREPLCIKLLLLKARHSIGHIRLLLLMTRHSMPCIRLLLLKTPCHA